MIKKREFPESNYRSIWFNGKTIRIAIDPTKPISELEYPEFLDVKLTGKCEGECPWCFLPGQKVNTINGLINIENIEIDDTVLSYDEINDSVCTSTVDQLHMRKYNDDIVIIELENNQYIKVTKNHKFFIKNRGWVTAENLTENDELFDI